MMQRLPMQPLSVGPAFGRLLAHTDEIPRSSKCRLLRVDRKCLNDATGEQAFETVPRQGRRQQIFGHKEVRYGDNSYPSRS
jgi:hypothetical protein